MDGAAFFAAFANTNSMDGKYVFNGVQDSLVIQERDNEAVIVPHSNGQHEVGSSKLKVKIAQFWVTLYTNFRHTL